MLHQRLLIQTPDTGNGWQTENSGPFGARCFVLQLCGDDQTGVSGILCLDIGLVET